MKRILTTLALATTTMFAVTAQTSEKSAEEAYLHPQEGKIERLYSPDFDHCDSAALAQLYREWEEYTRQHPTDGLGWHNFSHVSQTYWMNRKWPEESQQARIDLMQRMRASIPDTYTYYYMMIHYSSVEDSDDNGEKWARAKYKYACKAMEVLPDDVNGREMQTIVGIMLEHNDTLRTKKLLSELYGRELISPNILQYHFNELQGMPDSALYIGNTQEDIIPKLVIQHAMGLHRDKVFYDQNLCYDKSYNARCFKTFGVPELDFDEWLRIHGTRTNEDYHEWDWHKKVVQHLCDHSPRPVCFSANGLSSDWLTDSLRARLYNEGLTMRYSVEPYDNFAVKRRNIENRYLLEYLLYPFQKPETWTRQRWRWANNEDAVAENYYRLLKDQLPWYKKNDRKTYLRLGRIFFRVGMRSYISQITHLVNQGADALPENVTMQDLEKFLQGMEKIDDNGIEKFLEEMEKAEKQAREADQNAETPTNEEAK